MLAINGNFLSRFLNCLRGKRGEWGRRMSEGEERNPSNFIKFSEEKNLEDYSPVIIIDDTPSVHVVHSTLENNAHLPVSAEIHNGMTPQHAKNTFCH